MTDSAAPMLRTVQDLHNYADKMLFAQEHMRALHAYSTLVQLHPNDLDARLRLADTLLAMGEVQAASYLYTIFARHAANGGYPLRALVAIKILEALEPELGQLLPQVAALYSKESDKLGRSVRYSLVAEGDALPEGLNLGNPPPKEELLPSAAQVGADLSRIAAYPENLPPIALLSELSTQAFARVLSAMKLVRKQPGETVISQGDAATAFYLIARGKAAVTAEQNGEKVHLADLGEGGLFGEMALVSDRPRGASVVTVDDCDILEFDGAALKALSAELTTVATALSNFTRERLLTNLMKSSPLFAPLSDAQRVDLMTRFTAHAVTAGAPLINEGDAGRGLYVLLEGSADVWRKDGGDKVLLATLQAGDVFGEISLVLEDTTTANVTAAQNGTVLFLARDLFAKLVETFPEIREYAEGLGDERMMDAALTMDASRASVLPPPMVPDELEVDIDIE